MTPSDFRPKYSPWIEFIIGVDTPQAIPYGIANNNALLKDVVTAKAKIETPIRSDAIPSVIFLGNLSPSRLLKNRA